MLNSGTSPLHLIFTSTERYSIEAEGQGFFFLHWTAIKEPNHHTHRRLQIQFYTRWIAKCWAFGLSICFISSRPCICNKAGDNTPFLHPSPASSHGSCPTYLTILAPGLPFATVASFVTCQLIRPRRHITSMCRQQGLKQLQFLFFKKGTRCLLSLIQRPCSQPNGICESPNGKISVIPQWAHVSSKGLDFSCSPPNRATGINGEGLPLMPCHSISQQLGHFAKFWCVTAPQYQNVSEGRCWILGLAGYQTFCEGWIAPAVWETNWNYP